MQIYLYQHVFLNVSGWFKNQIYSIFEIILDFFVGY